MSKALAIAHRGYSSVAPENTLVAYRKALELKPDFVECDVRRTKDGQMIVIHDPTVDRTTNGSGAVADMTLDELQRFDAGSWFAPEYAGERLPSLREYLSLPFGDTKYLIEIKEDGTEEQVVNIVQEMGLADRTAICSFHYRVGLRLRELEPRIVFSPLIGGREPVGRDDAVRMAHEAAAVNGRIFGVHYPVISPELVEATHAANMLLEAWTVDDEQTMRSLIHMGVDVIGSNDVALLVRVLADMGVR